MGEMTIQWYPGHMTRTRRMMEADLKLVDVSPGSSSSTAWTWPTPR